MGLIVVAVTDVCGCYEQLEGIIILDVQSSTLNLLLELPHPLLPVAGREKIKSHRSFLGKRFEKRVFRAQFLNMTEVKQLGKTRKKTEVLSASVNSIYGAKFQSWKNKLPSAPPGTSVASPDTQTLQLWLPREQQAPGGSLTC